MNYVLMDESNIEVSEVNGKVLCKFKDGSRKDMTFDEGQALVTTTSCLMHLAILHVKSLLWSILQKKLFGRLLTQIPIARSDAQNQTLRVRVVARQST